jgi:hypothetical protein
MKSKRKPARLALLLALPVLLAACGQNIVGIASCEVGSHVGVSKGDVLTEPTAADIERNNKSREAAGCIKPQRVASKQ